MKTTRIALFVLLLLGLAGGASFASVRTSVGVSVHSDAVDLGFFYDDLAPYGTWIQRPSYGWVWTPDVAASWRPYTDGHWVWTDQGWAWISDEPFGWATYHYGRWYDDSEIGWTWVPGYDWAPSWVSWQEEPDYVGWAPLPPSVHLVSGFNGARLSLAIGAADYVFVPDRHFLAPSLVTYVVPAPQVLPIFRRSRNVTAYRFARGRVHCEGVPVSRFQRFGRGRVQRFQVADLGRSFRHRGARFEGGRAAFFRPQVRRARIDPPNLRPAARRSAVTLSEFRANRGRRFDRRFDRAVPAPARPGRAEFRSEDRRRETRLKQDRRTEARKEVRLRNDRNDRRRDQIRTREVTRERSRVIRSAKPPSREVTRQRSREVRRATPPAREVRRQAPSREVRRISPPSREVKRSREVRPPRTRVLSRQRDRSPEVRTQSLRTERRVQRFRAEPRVRHVERARPSAPRMRHSRPEQSLRSAPSRQTDRVRVHQAPRQQRQERAAQRQQSRRNRNRPPR